MLCRSSCRTWLPELAAISVEGGVGFHEGRQVVQVLLHDVEVGPHALQGFVGDPHRSQLHGLDFQAAAQFDELAGPRLPSIRPQLSVRGRSSETPSRRYVPEPGRTITMPEDFQGGEGFADGRASHPERSGQLALAGSRVPGAMSPLVK